jgi:hypothetical protein
VLLCAGGLFAAPEPADKAAKDEPESEPQQSARKMAGSIRLSTVVDGERQQLELLAQPVLRFGDISRDNEQGSIWIWQHRSRPQAIMELFRNTKSPSWAHAIQSLSTEHIDGDFGAGAPAWSPRQAGVKWNSFPDAPAPAGRPAVRIRQIKELAQRFTAHEFWDPNNSRFELRLLIQPAHRYSDPASGLVDGCVFLFCHETNPEVVLLIEAVKKDDADVEFRYALARLGHAELHVQFDNKEVWQESRVAAPSSRDPYFLVLKRQEGP